jgi:hypothetical protein
MIEYLTEIIIASVFTIPTVAFAWGNWGGGGVTGTGGFGAAGGNGNGNGNGNVTTIYDLGGGETVSVSGDATTEERTEAALLKAISESQAAHPDAWAKATGTTDKTEQRAIVTNRQKKVSQHTLNTAGIITYDFDGSIATRQDKWMRPAPSQELLSAIAQSQAAYPDAWAVATGTTDKETQVLSVTHGFTGAPVQVTDVVGGEFTFLSQTPMPSGSIISQTEFNTLVQKYGKDS